MSDLPTLKEELDRKTLEALDFLFNGVTSGKLSAAQFSTGLDAVFMATSGLACSMAIDLITAGGELIEGIEPEFFDKRVLCKKDTVVVVKRRLGDDKFSVTTFLSGAQLRHTVVEKTTGKEATDAMETTVDKLKTMGYSEL